MWAGIRPFLTPTVKGNSIRHKCPRGNLLKHIWFSLTLPLADHASVAGVANPIFCPSVVLDSLCKSNERGEGAITSSKDHIHSSHSPFGTQGYYQVPLLITRSIRMLKAER